MTPMNDNTPVWEQVCEDDEFLPTVDEDQWGENESGTQIVGPYGPEQQRAA